MSSCVISFMPVVCVGILDHYENSLMYYTENFFRSKIENFVEKKKDIFNFFTQNIDCG